jgi:hypothetical protein
VTAPQPWDWPPDPKRRSRIEILPPQPEVVRVTIHHRPRTNLLPLIFVALALFMVLRLGLGPFVMAAALLGLLPH